MASELVVSPVPSPKVQVTVSGGIPLSMSSMKSADSPAQIVIGSIVALRLLSTSRVCWA